MDLDGGKIDVANEKQDIANDSKSTTTIGTSITGSTKHSTGPAQRRDIGTSRLMATDSHNPVFEEILASRDPNIPRVNVLKEQRVSVIILEIKMLALSSYIHNIQELRKLAWAQALERMAKREEEDRTIISSVSCSIKFQFLIHLLRFWCVSRLWVQRKQEKLRFTVMRGRKIILKSYY